MPSLQPHPQFFVVNTNFRWKQISRRALLKEEIYARVPLPSTNKIFPFLDAFELNGKTVESRKIIDMLDPMLSDLRRQTILKVISSRTFSVLPVVEGDFNGVVNSGNIAAVLRSADGLGYGALHCIEHHRGFRKLSERCSSGAEKWVHLKTWTSPVDCLESIRMSGYRILAAHLAENSIPVQEVDWTIPTAIVFGNEGEGVSETVLEHSDGSVIIPMTGFVESFNISVAAALILYEARRSRVTQLGYHGDLTPEQLQILQAAYYIRHKDRMLSAASEILRRSPPDSVII